MHATTGAYEFIGDVRHRGVETSLSGALNSTLTTVIGARPASSFDIGVEYIGERAASSRALSATGAQLMLSDSMVVDLGARYRIDALEIPMVVRAQLLNAFDEFRWRSAPGETLDYTPQRSLRLLLTMEF